MRKYLMRYLIFWLPAAVVALFYNNTTMLSQVLQWFFAFLMLFGWSVNTGMATYDYPRHILSILFAYTGLNILIILALYNTHYGTAWYFFLQNYASILSFKPLEIFIMAMIELSIQHEIYVLGILVAGCLLGYIAGLVYRGIRPNPYRPRIRRSRYR